MRSILIFFLSSFFLITASPNVEASSLEARDFMDENVPHSRVPRERRTKRNRSRSFVYRPGMRAGILPGGKVYHGSLEEFREKMNLPDNLDIPEEPNA